MKAHLFSAGTSVKNALSRRIFGKTSAKHYCMLKLIQVPFSVGNQNLFSQPRAVMTHVDLRNPPGSTRHLHVHVYPQTTMQLQTT
jgi:hypothetical protein